MNSSNLLTIVIPSRNRHKYLLRGIEYYEKSKFKVLIADSTIKPLVLPKKINNIEYFHFPDYSIVKKLHAVYSLIETKYCVMSADDDFLIFSALDESISFLNNNSDYSVAIGLQMVYKVNQEKKIIRSIAYLNLFNLILFGNYDNSYKRLTNYSYYYIPLLYGVQRTKNVNEHISLCKPFLLDKNHFNYYELFQAYFSVLSGKIKIVRNLYYVRESIPNSAGRYNNSYNDFVNDEIIKNQFIEALSNNFSSKNLTALKTRKSIIKSIHIHKRHAFPSQKRLFKLYKRFSSVIKKRILMYFIKRNRNFENEMNKISGLVLKYLKLDNK